MSAYFFKLEKSHAKYSAMSQLNLNGIVTDNKESISKCCYDYFSSLYKTKFDNNAMVQFFQSIDHTNMITEEENLICDSPLTQQEIFNAILQLKSNRSPGVDGIISEFYKEFAELLAPFLFNVFFGKYQ